MQVTQKDSKSLDTLYAQIDAALTQSKSINTVAVAQLGKTTSDALDMLTLLAPLVQQSAQFTALISQAQDELVRQRAANASEQAEHEAALTDMQREKANALADRDLYERQILELREKRAAEEKTYSEWKSAKNEELEHLRISLAS